MNEIKLGRLITQDESRDAIHIAIAPVVASERLSPGSHVGLDSKGEAKKTTKTIGIVDPFLLEVVDKGETFFLLLYPNSITSLRHEWSHPSFDDKSNVINKIELDETKDDEAPYDNYCAICDYDDESLSLAPKHTPSPASEEWLRNYALELGHTYKDLIQGAKDYIHNGEYLHIGDNGGTYTSAEFWRHFDAVTGYEVGNRGNFFSCSC